MTRNAQLEQIFPLLQTANYSVTSVKTPNYNCIAWAADDTDHFWWPDQQQLGYWPPDVPREETLEAFVKAYEFLGYFRCDSDIFEEDFEKIAIYVKPSGKPTHAARQLPSGKWTSKLGQLEDIEHEKLSDLNGNRYGSVAIIMKRSKRA